MKNSLFGLLILAALVFQMVLPPPGFCERRPGPAGGEDGRPEMKGREKHGMLSEEFLGKLNEHLKLSAEQKEQVQEILDKSRPGMEKLKVEMEAVQEKMKAAMRAAQEGIRGALDMDQKEKFDEMMLRMKRRMMGPRQMGGPGAWKGGKGGAAMEEREVEIRRVRKGGQDEKEGREGPEPKEGDEEGSDD